MSRRMAVDRYGRDVFKGDRVYVGTPASRYRGLGRVVSVCMCESCMKSSTSFRRKAINVKPDGEQYGGLLTITADLVEVIPSALLYRWTRGKCYA
jgi:hypothetical protein